MHMKAHKGPLFDYPKTVCFCSESPPVHRSNVGCTLYYCNSTKDVRIIELRLVRF